MTRRIPTVALALASEHSGVSPAWVGATASVTPSRSRIVSPIHSVLVDASLPLTTVRRSRPKT